MHPPTLRCVFLTAVSVLCQSTSFATAASDSTLDALIARARSIYSARIDFTLTTNRKNRRMQNRYRFSQSGNDWALRYPGSPATLLNTRDTAFRFYQTKAPTGEVYRALHLTGAQSLGNAIGGNYACAAARLGTVWYDKQLEFLQQHRNQVEIKPNQSILGIPTTLLQWTVNFSELGSAFVVVSGQVDQSFTGFLKIFTAPGFGYAIPRIDYVSANGILLRRYEANDFIKVGDAIYFPQTARCISFFENHRETTTFSIDQIQYVNTELPKDDFNLQVPEDSRIRDSRPGAPHSAFQLEKQSDLESIRRLIQQDPNPNPALSFRFIFFVINLLITTFLIFLWIRQRCSTP